MAHPRLWGDTYWNTMHSLAALIQVSEENTRVLRAAFIAFVSYMPALLPCPNCVKWAPIKIMKHFGKADIKNNFENVDLNALMCDIHNEVSESLKPPKPTMTHEMAQARAVQLSREVSTKLMWDFVIIATRSLTHNDSQLSYTRCMNMLAVMLYYLDQADIASIIHGLQNAVTRQPARDQKSLLNIIYLFYNRYCSMFNQTCLSKEDFINHQMYGRTKSPLTLVPMDEGFEDEKD